MKKLKEIIKAGLKDMGNDFSLKNYFRSLASEIHSQN